MLYMIDPQFLAPGRASSLGAIAIGLLAETFFVLIINSLRANGALSLGYYSY